MLLARVRRTIRERRLLVGVDRVVVACSGGPDSVALAHVLARLASELGIGLALASVDHGLRPEAGAEVASVRALSTALGVPFHPLSVEVDRSRPSLQAAARRARYRALLALSGGPGARLAVGHTMDDQAETVLARLLRGAGIDGLSGIEPRRADGVVRPLIDARRTDVEAWLRSHGLPSHRDPSNEDRRFLRARVRHDLLPPLVAESPRLVPHLAALADEARAARRAAVREARRHLAREGGGSGAPPPVLDASRLVGLRPAARRHVLRGWVRARAGRGLGRTHLDSLERLLVGDAGGACLLGGGWEAQVRGRGDTRTVELDYRTGGPTRGHPAGPPPSACPEPPGSPDAEDVPRPMAPRTDGG